MTDLIETVPPRDVAIADMEQRVEAWRDSHAIYSPLLPRRAQRTLAPTSLQGLLSEGPRKSIAPMVWALTGGNPHAVRAMQSCIREGAWDDETLWHQPWQEVETDVGTDEGVLRVAGSDVPPQGLHAAGVTRQSCGALGKRANGQAGVFVGDGSLTGSTLLDRRLSLPEAWVTEAPYAARRTPGGMAEHLPCTTQPALASAMSAAVVTTHHLRWQWVVADAAFGADPAFLDGVAGHGLGSCAAVPHRTRVWGERPATPGPAWRGRGRRPTRARLGVGAPEAQTVVGHVAWLPAEAWSRHPIKAGRKGPLVADVTAVRVLGVREGWPGPDGWLVLRRYGETGELQTSLCHAPADTAMGCLVRMSGMRWPMETGVEDGKQLLGRGDYAVRGGTGWDHPMPLVILAHCFLVRMGLTWKQKRQPSRGPRSCWWWLPSCPCASLTQRGHWTFWPLASGGIMPHPSHIASAGWGCTPSGSESSL
jgi:SRSO17 transposase